MLPTYKSLILFMLLTYKSLILFMFACLISMPSHFGWPAKEVICQYKFLIT